MFFCLKKFCAFREFCVKQKTCLLRDKKIGANPQLIAVFYVVLRL